MYIPFWLKLFLAYSAVIICVFGIVLTLVFPQIIRHSKAEIKKRMDASSAHVIESLEYQLDTMRSIYIKLKSDPHLQDAFQARSSDAVHAPDRYIIETMNSLSQIWNRSIYIYIYDCQNNTFYNSKLLSSTSMTDSSWINDIEQTHGMFNFRIATDKNDFDKATLTIGDTIHQSLFYKKLAYFSVNINLLSLERQILPPGDTAHTLQIITDRTGAFVLGDHIQPEGTPFHFQEDRLLLNGKQYIVSHAVSPHYGFTHYILVPEQEAYHDLNLVLYVILMTVLGILVMAILISFFLARQTTIPIKQLTDMVTQYNGNDETRPVIKDLHLNNEFSILNTRLIQMADKISTLINDVYQQEINQQQLELQTLYKTINPHFIYNILDTIQWELRLHKTDCALKTLYSFSHYLRNTLVMNQELRTMKALEAAVQDYCDLQNIVSDQINCEIHIPNELADYVIPSMVVLPLVENCFIHAFPDDFSGEKKITVSAHATEENLIISIADTGCGIAQDDLLTIEKVLENPLNFELEEGNTRFFAIKNIQSRIHLSCGKNYGIKITSTEDGTNSVLYLPLQTKQKK